MERRKFLGGLGSAVAATILTPLTIDAQEGSADRLRLPGAVQQRGVVTEAQNDATIKGVEQRLKCTCGCNLDIFTCRTTDFTCTTSPALHREIVALFEAGNSPETVIQTFIEQYGEEILMAPKAEGFNLAGYLVPGTALLVAGSILAAVLLRRHRLASENAAVAVPVRTAGAPVSAAGDDLARLQRALEEVDS